MVDDSFTSAGYSGLAKQVPSKVFPTLLWFPPARVECCPDGRSQRCWREWANAMRTKLHSRFITLALVVTFLVALGAGSEAAAARHKQYDRGAAPRPRPMVGPSSGEPDQTNGLPAPPKMGQTAIQRNEPVVGVLNFHQWMVAWAQLHLKRF